MNSHRNNNGMLLSGVWLKSFKTRRPGAQQKKEVTYYCTLFKKGKNYVSIVAEKQK